MPRPLESPRGAATRPRRLAACAGLAGLTVFVLAGTHAPSTASAGWRDWTLFRSQSPDEDDKENKT